MPIVFTAPVGPAQFSQIQKIVDPLGSGGDLAGVSVSLSGDGTTLAIGEHGDASTTGRVLIYTWNGSAYVLQDTLTPSLTQVAQEFGQFLALNTDGNYLIVGADAYDGGNNNEGRGYVFHRVGVVWSEQEVLEASDAAISDALGRCAISGAGDIIVMGAVNQDAGASNAGAAYVWTRSGVVWTQVAKLVDPSASIDGRMGIDVDISRDGSTIITGVYALGTATLGKALVFDGPNWAVAIPTTLQGADTAFDDDFGRSVSLSSNGDVTVIGSYHDDVSAVANAGSAYVFNRVLTVWGETQKVSASVLQNSANLGAFVDMNDAGTKFAVGAGGWDESGQVDNGTAYVFELIGTWTQTQQLLPGDLDTSKFFGSVSGMGDFSRLAVGAPGDTILSSANYGSVYIFET